MSDHWKKRIRTRSGPRRVGVLTFVSGMVGLAAYDGHVSTALFVGFIALGTLHAIATNSQTPTVKPDAPPATSTSPASAASPDLESTSFGFVGFGFFYGRPRT